MQIFPNGVFVVDRCRLRDDVESWEVDLERHPSGVVYVREDGTIDPEPVVAWSHRHWSKVAL